MQRSSASEPAKGNFSAAPSALNIVSTRRDVTYPFSKIPLRPDAGMATP